MIKNLLIVTLLFITKSACAECYFVYHTGNTTNSDNSTEIIEFHFTSNEPTKKFVGLEFKLFDLNTGIELESKIWKKNIKEDLSVEFTLATKREYYYFFELEFAPEKKQRKGMYVSFQLNQDDLFPVHQNISFDKDGKTPDFINVIVSFDQKFEENIESTLKEIIHNFLQFDELFSIHSQKFNFFLAPEKAYYNPVSISRNTADFGVDIRLKRMVSGNYKNNLYRCLVIVHNKKPYKLGGFRNKFNTKTRIMTSSTMYRYNFEHEFMHAIFHLSDEYKSCTNFSESGNMFRSRKDAIEFAEENSIDSLYISKIDGKDWFRICSDDCIMNSIPIIKIGEKLESRPRILGRGCSIKVRSSLESIKN